jgi:hypothetical protein
MPSVKQANVNEFSIDNGFCWFELSKLKGVQPKTSLDGDFTF